jgi:hypothetical protein
MADEVVEVKHPTLDPNSPQLKQQPEIDPVTGILQKPKSAPVSPVQQPAPADEK